MVCTSAPDPTAYLGLVRLVAARYRNCGLSLDDLVSEGTVGLMQAVKKYKPDRCPMFEPYAKWRIRGSILTAIDRELRHKLHILSAGAMEAIPATSADDRTTVLDLLCRLHNQEKRAVSLWIGLDGPAYSYSEIGDNLGVSKQRAHALVRAGLARLRRRLQDEEEVEGTPEGVAHVRS